MRVGHVRILHFPFSILHLDDAEWYGMVCSNIFAKVEQPNSQPILLPNGESVYFKLDINTNAYYFVDVVVGSPAPIYFNANGESNLGNPIVVARAGEINHVPMLIGATYSISSSVPVNVSLPIDGHAEILHLTESVCSVVWPLHLDLTGTAAASECEYSLTVGPFDPGGQIVWEEHGHLMMGEGEGQSGSADCQCVTYDGSCAYFRCGSHCSCGGTCRARGHYWLEGMSFPFQGGNCTCGGDAVVVENNNHTLGLSTSVPPCLLLKSGWMDGSCSATVACAATNSEIVDREVNAWVASGVVKVDSALTAMYSFTVPAGQTVTRSILLEIY